MTRTLLLIAAILSMSLFAHAEVEPVVVRAPTSKAWIGQRLAFHVELRALGSFSGSPSFDLPQIPGTLVIKVGEAVVDSAQLEGETWFVQTHEFALFSQRPGELELPPFTVRFSRREGFTGPASEVRAQTESLTFEIQRPPGSEHIGFLITTESLEVNESWDPAPGPTEVGAMFKRTVTQRADQMLGIALAPVPTDASEGIRVYDGQAETKDNLSRGDFIGERSETVTYLIQGSGTLELPALTYTWWNPKTEVLESKTLPAVTLEVAAAPSPPSSASARSASDTWPAWLAVAIVSACLVWQRRRLAGFARRGWQALNPPDRVAARHLMRACRRDDAASAESAWAAWLRTQRAGYRPGQELRGCVLDLQRSLFGREPGGAWQGAGLARAFRHELAAAKPHRPRDMAFALPSLNPPAEARRCPPDRG